MLFSEQAFNYLQTFLRNESGLELDATKTYLVEYRLKPIIQVEKLQSIEDLVQKMQQPNTAALKKEVVEAMTTNETFFFRDQKPFEVFKKIVIPDLAARNQNTKTLRIWSAAASTGQESYSIAMCLFDIIPFVNTWKIEILATDIDDTVLIQTAAGKYTQYEVKRGLTEEHLKRYFTQQDDKWIVKEDLRKLVKIMKVNLLNPALYLGSFDCVFCRNVLIYFNVDNKKLAIKKIASSLKPDSYFFIGSTESLLGISDDFLLQKNDVSTIYYKKK